ncbi:hypothetical protein TIFTF001_036045, partial [Ficus carica]
MIASSNSIGPNEQLVLVEDKLFARILTLNRSRQLNALTYQMVLVWIILGIPTLIPTFEYQPTEMSFVHRAFCAGADVAALVRDVTEGNWRSTAQLFQKELTLNYLMATYYKPQVSILNDIVMGDGAGALIHGRFRVAIENSVLAMPETALGHFPDVGASYFLSRLPRFFGEYLGLTGSRLDGAEMLACGLATHFVPSTILKERQRMVKGFLYFFT